jgi:hypothetical protein
VNVRPGRSGAAARQPGSFITPSRIVLACLVVILALAWFFGVALRPATDDTTDRDNKIAYEQGVQWAGGYLEAVRDTPHVQAQTSLYGACVIQFNTVIIPAFNNEGKSNSWFGGCLSKTRDPIATTPTRNTP